MTKHTPTLTVKEARERYWQKLELWQAVKDDPYASYFQLRDAAAAVANAKRSWEDAVAATYSGRGNGHSKRSAAIRTIAALLNDAGTAPSEFGALRASEDE